MPLVKGQTYFTTKARASLCSQNGGWLLVEDSNGKKGYIPASMVKSCKINRPPSEFVETKISNDVTTIPSMFPLMDPSTVPEQAQPTIGRMPITDVHDNPISLPHPLNDSNELEKNKKWLSKNIFYNLIIKTFYFV